MRKIPFYTRSDGSRAFMVSGPVDEPTFDALNEEAARTGTTRAAQMRQAVDEYVARLGVRKSD